VAEDKKYETFSWKNVELVPLHIYFEFRFSSELKSS
jgi:hypothetical protein